MEGTTYAMTIDLPEEESELLAAELYDFGATGLEVRDSEAPPMPGVRGPHKGEAIVIAYFGEETEAQKVAQSVVESFPRARAEVRPIALQDWSESWKSLIRSVEVGRLWVGPPWEQNRAPAGKVQVVIEPKMAFGTGDHPTTCLCLKAIDAFVAAHPGCSVLDVGTGTGVLAIAARKLGAGRCTGLDNDPTSVKLAQENALVNQTPELWLSGEPLQALSDRFDLVVANILANTLVELAPLIVPRVKNRLVLAGVLGHQREEVSRAYVALGLRPDGVEEMGEWIRLDFRA